jgi:hypothetical protein
VKLSNAPNLGGKLCIIVGLVVASSSATGQGFVSEFRGFDSALTNICVVSCSRTAPELQVSVMTCCFDIVNLCVGQVLHINNRLQSLRQATSLWAHSAHR